MSMNEIRGRRAARWLTALLLAGGTSATAMAQFPSDGGMLLPGLVQPPSAQPATSQTPSGSVTPIRYEATQNAVVVPTADPIEATPQPAPVVPLQAAPVVPITAEVQPSFTMPAAAIPVAPEATPVLAVAAIPVEPAPSAAVVESAFATSESKPGPKIEDRPVVDKPFRTAVKLVPNRPVVQAVPVQNFQKPEETPAPVRRIPERTLVPVRHMEEQATLVESVAAPEPVREQPKSLGEGEPPLRRPTTFGTTRLVLGSTEQQSAEAPAHIPVVATAPASSTTPVAASGGAAASSVASTPSSSGEAGGSCSSCGSHGCHGCTLGDMWRCLLAPSTRVPVLGSTEQSIFMLQRNNALAEYFTVYREDFFPATGAALNATGIRHLEGIVHRLGLTGAPVKVEVTGNGALDQQRRLAVVDAIVRLGVPPAEAQQRVTFGKTIAEGLRGLDIQVIPYPNLRRGGGGGSGGSGSGGGMGGAAGFGGGGGGGGGGFGGYGGYR